MRGQVPIAGGGRNRQGGGPRETVDRGPDRVARHIGRIGEVEEGAAGQGGVQEVLPGAAEDLLADHHAEGNAQGDLPQRHVRRQDQGVEHRGNEETFVDFMPTDGGEQDFPEAAGHQRRDVYGEEVERPVDHVHERVVRIEADPQELQDPGPPPRGTEARDRRVDLKPGVVPAEENAGDRRDDHVGHDPLHVDVGSRVGRRRGHRLGRVEEALHHFVEGEELLPLAARQEARLDPVKKAAKSQGPTLPSRSSSGSRARRDRIRT